MMELSTTSWSRADEASSGNTDLVSLLRKAVSLFDGGFTVGSLLGNGDSFVFQPPRHPPGLLYYRRRPW